MSNRHIENGAGHEGLAYDSADERQIEYLTKKNAALKALIRDCVSDLEKIVCVKEPADGVVLLSNEGTIHYDGEAHVYDHAHFSPLGDALIALHRKLKGTP